MKKMQRFFSCRSNDIPCTVVGVFRTDKPGIHQVMNDLLNRKVVGIFPV